MFFNTHLLNQGIELLAHEGGTPVFIDLSKPKNLLLAGTTGSGKSVLFACILAYCLAQNMSAITLDLPNSDGTGTFGDFTPFFNGIYFDISKESNNLMQPLDVSTITNQEEQNRRIQEHRNDVTLIITRLVLVTDRLEGFLVETIESLIPLGINAFYQDPEIQARFEAARREGLGSKAWNNTPTIADLKEFYSTKHINLSKQDANTEQALNFIRLRLEFWLNSSLNQAIGKPSTFDIDHSQGGLITFALTNLQSEKEAEILGLSAHLAARRQSLSSLNSVFFMDEASVLLGYPSLSTLTGRLCATARKSGCRIILAAQDVDSIAKSAAGAQILQNMPCRLIGRILPGAAKSYQKHLDIPEEIVSQNEAFKTNTSQVYTRWLLDYQNTYTHCRHYPSYPMLALTANSREEQAMRDKFKAQYPNKFEWLTEFYRYYKKYIRQGEIK
jgi:type IV secretory pathway VirB4 component